MDILQLLEVPVEKGEVLRIAPDLRVLQTLKHHQLTPEYLLQQHRYFVLNVVHAVFPC